MKKTFVAALGIIILGGGFYLYKNSNPNASREGWITHRNTNLQFEVSYPKDWQISESDPNSTTEEKLTLIGPSVSSVYGYEQQNLRCVLTYDVTQNKISFLQNAYYYSDDIQRIAPYMSLTNPSDTYCPFNMGTSTAGEIASSIKFYNTSLSNETVAVPVFDESSWKSYVGADNKFQIEIPNGFVADSGPGGSIYFRSPQTELEYKTDASKCDGVNHPGVCWSFANDAHADLIFSNGGIDDGNGSIKTSNVIINGITWQKFYPVRRDSSPDLYQYSISHGGESYSFFAPDEKLLQQVLSTFRVNK
ncbi:MAG TPA: hypothetical protein VFT82_01705 [Candidatus Paceibacterota bacterium]|nr:hypothetical protein [Candidatus Paceibacterota bacterium]